MGFAPSGSIGEQPGLIEDRAGAVVRALDLAALGIAPEQPVDLEGAERGARSALGEGPAKELAALDRRRPDLDLPRVTGLDLAPGVHHIGKVGVVDEDAALAKHLGDLV